MTDIDFLSGDYLFGDSDGVVVVPAAVAGEIIDLAKELLHREHAIEAARGTASLDEQAQARKTRFSHVCWLRGSGTEIT